MKDRRQEGLGVDPEEEKQIKRLEKIGEQIKIGAKAGKFSEEEVVALFANLKAAPPTTEERANEWLNIAIDVVTEDRVKEILNKLVEDGSCSKETAKIIQETCEANSLSEVDRKDLTSWIRAKQEEIEQGEVDEEAEPEEEEETLEDYINWAVSQEFLLPQEGDRLIELAKKEPLVDGEDYTDWVSKYLVELKDSPEPDSDLNVTDADLEAKLAARNKIKELNLPSPQPVAINSGGDDVIIKNMPNPNEKLPKPFSVPPIDDAGRDRLARILEMAETSDGVKANAEEGKTENLKEIEAQFVYAENIEQLEEIIRDSKSISQEDKEIIDGAVLQMILIQFNEGPEKAKKELDEYYNKFLKADLEKIQNQALRAKAESLVTELITENEDGPVEGEKSLEEKIAETKNLNELSDLVRLISIEDPDNRKAAADSKTIDNFARESEREGIAPEDYEALVVKYLIEIKNELVRTKALEIVNYSPKKEAPKDRKDLSFKDKLAEVSDLSALAKLVESYKGEDREVAKDLGRIKKVVEAAADSAVDAAAFEELSTRHFNRLSNEALQSRAWELGEVVYNHKLELEKDAPEVGKGDPVVRKFNFELRTEEDRFRAIFDAPSFEELFEAIRRIGVIKGSTQSYDPEELINVINVARSEKSVRSQITNAYGIWDKVEKLISKEESLPPENRADQETIERTKIVKEAQSFEELAGVIRKIGPIVGSSKTYETEELVALINIARANDFGFSKITNTYGIRDKVLELKARGGEAAVNLPEENETADDIETEKAQFIFDVDEAEGFSWLEEVIEEAPDSLKLNKEDIKTGLGLAKELLLEVDSLEEFLEQGEMVLAMIPEEFGLRKKVEDFALIALENKSKGRENAGPKAVESAKEEVDEETKEKIYQQKLKISDLRARRDALNRYDIEEDPEQLVAVSNKDGSGMTEMPLEEAVSYLEGQINEAERDLADLEGVSWLNQEIDRNQRETAKAFNNNEVTKSALEAHQQKLGEKIKESAWSAYKKEMKEVGKNKKWQWAWERVKGFCSFGLYDFIGAERVRRSTNNVAEIVSGQLKVLNIYNRPEESLRPEEKKVLNEMKNKAALDAEKVLASQVGELTPAEKAEVLDRALLWGQAEHQHNVEEQMIEKSVREFDSWLVNTKAHKLSRIPGLKNFGLTKTSAGDFAWTDQKKLELIGQLRMEAAKTRINRDVTEFKDLATLMKKNIDPNYWARYVYGGIEMALASAAVVYVAPLFKAGVVNKVGAKAGVEAAKQAKSAIIDGNLAPSDLTPKPQTLVDKISGAPRHFFSDVAKGISVEGTPEQIEMKKTVWHTMKAWLENNGVNNPTNAQILEATKITCSDNQIGIKEFGSTGKVMDVKMQNGFPLSVKGLTAKLATKAAFKGVSWGVKQIYNSGILV